MVCNAEAVLGFYFFDWNFNQVLVNIEVAFNGKFSAWLITIHVG